MAKIFLGLWTRCIHIFNIASLSLNAKIPQGFSTSHLVQTFRSTNSSQFHEEQILSLPCECRLQIEFFIIFYWAITFCSCQCFVLFEQSWFSFNFSMNLVIFCTTHCIFVTQYSQTPNIQKCVFSFEEFLYMNNFEGLKKPILKQTCFQTSLLYCFEHFVDFVMINIYRPVSLSLLLTEKLIKAQGSI